MPDKITQKDVIDSSVVKEFEKLNDELKESVKLMTALTKASIDLSKEFNPNNVQQVIDSQKDQSKES